METISREISTKFNLTSQLIEKLTAVHNDYCISLKDNILNHESFFQQMKKLCTELDSLLTRYIILSSPIILQASVGGSGKVLASEKFQHIIAAEGILNHLDSIIHQIENIFNQSNYGIQTKD